jgi:uncharacterized protein YjbJ (UPF0337 family)
MAFLLVAARGWSRAFAPKSYSPTLRSQRLGAPASWREPEWSSSVRSPEKSSHLRIFRKGMALALKVKPAMSHKRAQQGVTAMDKDRIAGSAKDVAGKVEGAVGDMTGNAQTQAAGRVREAEGTVQNLYGQAKDTARDAGEAAVNYAKDAYEHSGETLRDGSQAVAKRVQDNPLGALLIAGGIGFALALLMTRPPRRPPQRWRYYG